MIDGCRAMLEKMCYLLQRQGQLGYARFLQGVQILPVDARHSQGGFLACVRPEASRFVIELFWPEFGLLPLVCQTEIMKHEILHVINGHAGRRGKELIDKYGILVANIAADLVVNQFIDTKALTASKVHPVTIETFGFEAGKTAFQYAEDLLRLAEENRGKPQPTLSDHRPLEEFVFEETELERELADSLQGRIVDESAKGLKGKLPGSESADSIEFFAALHKPPEVDWRAVLRVVEMRQRSSNKDTCWRRESRRMEGMPGRIRVQEALSLWLAVDTSASMGNDLSLVDAELKGIAARGAKIKVLHFDTEIVKEETYNRRAELSSFHGRGGTCFTPVFNKLVSVPSSEVPGVLVVFTDGFGTLSMPEALSTAPTGVARKERTKQIEVIWLLTAGNKETFLKRGGACGQVIELRNTLTEA